MIEKISYQQLLQKIILKAKLPAEEADAILKGSEGLSENQLYFLLKIIHKQPDILSLIAKKSHEKRIIFSKSDKESWVQLLQQEEEQLGRQFLELLEQQEKKKDQKKIEKIKLSL